MKRPGRKADLRRLAAKQGWYAGNAGEDGNPPTKSVMSPRGGLAYNAVPKDEEAAYWSGYEEGKQAARDGIPGNANPYGKDA